MKSKLKLLIQAGLLLSFAIFHSNVESQSVKPLLKPGDPIPSVEITADLSKAEKDYLGIKSTRKFKLNEIQASVIIVEFFNKYCPHCQRQAPIMNELYQAIQQDVSLKDNVKMLKIGSGNTTRQIKLLKQEKNIPFPLIPDDQFILHDEVGRPRTPFIIFFKKTDDGKGVVSATFLGMVLSKDQLLENIRTLINSDILVLDQEAPILSEKERSPEFRDISDEEFENMVAERLSEFDEKLLHFERVLVIDKNFDIIYKVRSQLEGKSKKEDHIFFIRKIYRNTVCGNCHDAHFWFSFDTNGKILHFYPIYLPKAYNKLWSKDDLNSFNKRILGKSILKKLTFNPEIDAVTTATITSSLIYDTLSKTKDLFAQLKKAGAMN